MSTNLDAVTLRLFNGIFNPIPVQGADFSAWTIPQGYVLDTTIPITKNVTNAVESYILDGIKMNATFHKSWSKVANASMIELVIEQLLHYLSTYGDMRGGIVYVPTEELNIPEVKSMPIFYVRSLSKQDIADEIVMMSEFALKEETLDDIMYLIDELGLYQDYLCDRTIANNELNIRLYDYLGTAPQEPVEFIRYMIYKLTGTSLIINSKQLKEQLEQADYRTVDKLMQLAPSNIEMAKVFYRYKDILLAIRKAASNTTPFNKIRKLANYYHVPVGVDYLNDITRQIADGEFRLKDFEYAIDDASFTRKARILPALSVRLYELNGMLYRIRNGKGYVKTASDSHYDSDSLLDAIDVVLNSIANNNVYAERYFIPSDIHYALPTSEKNYVGNFPSYTYLDLADDAIFGIYWEDAGFRTDLDLSLIRHDGKFGWDGSYRDRNSLLFSGDQTSAAYGAAEAFYVSDPELIDIPIMLNVDFYNMRAVSNSVNAKIFAGSYTSESPFSRSGTLHNYVLDPNNLVLTADIQINKYNTLIGFISDSRFYFFNTSISNTRSIQASHITELALDYMANISKSVITLDDLVAYNSYFQIVRTEEECTVNLAPFNLTRSSIRSMFHD